MTDPGGITEEHLLAWITVDQDGERPCKTLDVSVHTFWLHYAYGLTFQMLGLRQGIAQSTVCRRIRIVRERLRHPDRRLDEVLDGTKWYAIVFDKEGD
jgi:hypothetical protein